MFIMPGLDPSRIVGDVEPDLLCDLCNKVFVNPVTNACPHVFCFPCIKKRLQSKYSRECPTCSTPLNETPEKPPDELMTKLSNIELRCAYKCDKTILMRDMDNHVKKECPNAPVRCANECLGCKVTPKRHLATQHENECDFRHVSCDACGYRTLYRDLFTHQKNKRCLERKLRGEVVKNLRKLNATVEQHRHDILNEHVRLQHEEREQIRQHKQKFELSKESLFNDITSTSDASGSESASSAESSPRGNFCNSPRYDPKLRHCLRCKKYFNPTKNRPRACVWHQGPTLELFGGTCHFCGRLDVQPGCVTGYHVETLTEDQRKDQQEQNEIPDLDENDNNNSVKEDEIVNA